MLSWVLGISQGIKQTKKKKAPALWNLHSSVCGSGDGRDDQVTHKYRRAAVVQQCAVGERLPVCIELWGKPCSTRWHFHKGVKEERDGSMSDKCVPGREEQGTKTLRRIGNWLCSRPSNKANGAGVEWAREGWGSWNPWERKDPDHGKSCWLVSGF